MDVGFRSPLLDFFKRGEVAKDVRVAIASVRRHREANGGLGLRSLTQYLAAAQEGGSQQCSPSGGHRFRSYQPGHWLVDTQRSKRSLGRPVAIAVCIRQLVAGC